ncbi:hypothetical protein TNCV_4088971 [Trichonephila clavipes]|nr:hypothetical protein TNCV_4088971 [Trichonephila clavipes]
MQSDPSCPSSTSAGGSRTDPSTLWVGAKDLLSILRKGIRRLFNHETCYTSRLSHPRAKRVCFDKDNGKLQSFKPDAVPENHFHLGSHNYAVVSDLQTLHEFTCADTSSMLLDLFTLPKMESL